jgi:heptosyltransferase-2
VSRLIPFAEHAIGPRRNRPRFREYIRATKRIRSDRYEAVFVLDRTAPDALMAWVARIPRRIGFTPSCAQMLLSHGVPYREEMHRVENFLSLLTALDIPGGSAVLELWPADQDERRVHALMENLGWKAEDLKIVISAAGRHASAQWPFERFGEVMAVVQKKYGVRFIYTGSAGDSALYRQIESCGPFHGLNTCGTMTVRENLAVYRAADLFFGVVSEDMHSAAAVGLPVVVLSCPADEKTCGPWGDGHTVVTKRSLRGPDGIRARDSLMLIGSEEATAALEGKINEIFPKLMYY